MSLKLFPYKIGSLSAKRLARALNVLRVGHNYNAKRSDTIINWGNSHPPHFRWMEQDLNKPQAIALACDKVKTFETLEYNNFKQIPMFTTKRHIAEHLIETGETIYCRSTVTGHSGRGIIICNDVNDLPTVPLYTVKTKHKDEYRVHVFKGEAIDVQKKKRKNSGTTLSNGIRNHASGWVYGRLDISPPSAVIEASIEAVRLLGLDFGAVDIGHRLRDNKVFVFEVNTAPGLEGLTLDNYAKSIYNYYRSL